MTHWERNRKRREALGLTQQQLAEEMGVGYRSLQRWEAGAPQYRSLRMLWDRTLEALEEQPIEKESRDAKPEIQEAGGPPLSSDAGHDRRPDRGGRSPIR